MGWSIRGGRKTPLRLWGTRKEVAAGLARAIANLDAGMIFDSINLTVAEHLDRWLDSVRGAAKERTLERHETLFRLHVKPAIGTRKLSKLSALHVQSLYRDRLDSGFAPNTVRTIHAQLHKALKQAVRWRLVPDNRQMMWRLPGQPGEKWTH